ncbi:MAG TPA: hypothetical protein VFD48_03080, partial [Pyrinomonadaceae bacterium]|nr:hypothetical protein [Pyrinomonadaceae bacterium]
MKYAGGRTDDGPLNCYVMHTAGLSDTSIIERQGQRLLALILTLNGFNLGNTLSVAVFTYVRAKPGVNNLTHFAACYGFTSEGENVGIVVFSGIARH